jgi:ribosome-associated toxin RatA of RatAB toxin-antitoxin module
VVSSFSVVGANGGNLHEQRFEAELTVGLPPLFKETYTSLVVTNPSLLTIASTSIKSQNIEQLNSLWQLQEMDDGKCCEVRLEVSMTVRDPIIVAALDQVLAGVASQQVAAFSKRCLEMPIAS